VCDGVTSAQCWGTKIVDNFTHVMAAVDEEKKRRFRGNWAPALHHPSKPSSFLPKPAASQDKSSTAPAAAEVRGSE